MKDIPLKTQLFLYQQMLKIREFEERIVELYSEQQMRCPVHLSIGQEATAVGMCAALEASDILFSHHRSHGHYIAKGGSLKKMLAEIYGKETGCSKGFGGSMHLVDLDAGIIATTPIVGGIIPVSVGAAFANKKQGKSTVTTLFIGDATVEEGVWHESLNFAILKKLSMVFFCENNFYSVYTPLKARQPNREIYKMVEGSGILTFTANGNNVLEVYQTVKKAYAHVKTHGEPVFIEAKTYRWREHCGPNYDNHIGYRTEKEFLDWKEKCPVAQMHNYLLSTGIASQADLEQIKKEVLLEIEEAVDFAKKSPFPNPQTVFENVYAD